MNIAICDDEPYLCEEIIKNIQAVPSHMPYKIYKFYSGDDLLASKIVFDMIFLDIELNNITNGFQIAKTLHMYLVPFILIHFNF